MEEEGRLNDEAVLNRILNPLLPAQIDDDEEKHQPTTDDSDVRFSEESKEEKNRQVLLLVEVKALEVKGVEEAEAGRFQEAIHTFSQAIDLLPHRPSAYNNRAQAYRLLGNIEGAMMDLNKAIELSDGKGKSGCQALTQRALIHRLQSRDQEAKADFERAAGLGSMFAKNQLIMMNPYAAMCNKMIAEVMGKLQRGEPEDQPQPGNPG